MSRDDEWSEHHAHLAKAARLVLPRGFALGSEGWALDRAWFASAFEIEPVAASKEMARVDVGSDRLDPAPGTIDLGRLLIRVHNVGFAQTAVIDRGIAWRGTEIQAALASLGVRIGTVPHQAESVADLIRGVTFTLAGG